MSPSNHRLDSDNASQYTELSISTTSTPQPTLKKKKSRSARRKISMATRRHSRMLYLEKYGLNQPGWYQGSQDDHDNNEGHHDDGMEDDNSCNDSHSDEEEEEQQQQQQQQQQFYTEEPEEISLPTSPVRQQTQPKERPVSIKNYVQNSHQQKRPNQFIKPQKSNIDVMSFPATEFRHVHDLIHIYTEKVYMEGYLYKKKELNTNGAYSSQQEKWRSYYVELCGPVLTLWTAIDDSEEEVYPQYINITDSIIKQENITTFSLNSAGSNRFLFQVQEEYLLKKWILAIRLSCFECAKIQEIYTSTFITRPQYKLLLNSNKNTKMEGFIQARFPGSTGWKRYWASIHFNDIKKKKKKNRMSSLFGIGKKSSSSKEAEQQIAEISFFESKKSKYPLMTVNNVVQVYTIYPESPKLINLATLFKIEGNLVSSNGNQLQGTSCLIMTLDTNELVKWLISLFDSFHLYGRPNSLYNDVKNQQSLNFSDLQRQQQQQQQQQQEKLFLDLQDVVNLVDHKSTLLNNKREFKNILYSKMMYGGDDSNNNVKPVNNIYTRDKRISSTTATTVQSPTHLRTVTCASDISSNDEKTQLEKENGDSDESSFKLKRLSIATTTTSPRNKKSMSTPTLLLSKQPITPIASKSNSEISSEASSSASSSSSFATPKDYPSKSFLPLVTVVGGNNGYTGPTSHYYDSKKCADTASITSATTSVATSTTKKKKNKNPRQQQQASQQQNDYTRQRANSMMSPLTAAPMYGSKLASASTSSVLGTSSSDYFGGGGQMNNWETSSVDPRMMINTSQFKEQDDDDKPIAFTQNSLLYQQQQKNISSAGSVCSTATSIATEKKKTKKQQQQKNQNMIDEQMMLRERLLQQQFMIQQYMMQQQQQQQQQYPGNGMIPMMVDPRMMQQYMMMNPQMMQSPSMYPLSIPTGDPRYFQQPVIPSPSTSTGTSSSYNKQSSSRQQGRYQQNFNDNQSMSGASVASNNRPNYKRQHMSSNPSVTSTTMTSPPQQQQQSATRRTRNY